MRLKETEDNRRHSYDEATQDCADRILRIIEGSGDIPSDGDMRILCRMAALSEEDEYDESRGYARLLSTLKRRRMSRRLKRVIKPISTAAAILVAGLFIFSQYFDLTGRKEVVVEEEVAVSKPQNLNGVLLTLRNGNVINMTDTPEDEQSTDDIKALEQASEIVPISDYNTIVVPRRRDYRLYLDDGSLLTFNSDTKVRFPNEFTSSERRIIVDYGEVFVQVMRDEQRPFIVEVKGSEIEVLGTSFNIHAYPESNVTTTLVTGKVRFRRGPQSVDITPGKQVIVDAQSHLMVQDVNVEDVMAWVRGYFVFDNMPLGKIMTHIERWYGFKAEFDSPELANFAFTGVMDKRDNMDYILELLRQTTDIEFYCTDDYVIHIGRSRMENKTKIP